MGRVTEPVARPLWVSALALVPLVAAEIVPRAVAETTLGCGPSATVPQLPARPSLALAPVALRGPQVAPALPVAVRADCGAALVHAHGPGTAAHCELRNRAVDGHLPVGLQQHADGAGGQVFALERKGDAPAAFPALQVHPAASVGENLNILELR